MSIPEKVTELIKKSGNNFHAKVAQQFVNNGWHVTVSPYYLDQTLGKAREIDLVAEKLWIACRSTVTSTEHYGHDIVVRLFIECKYIPQLSPSVFWFADKDSKSAKELICSGRNPFTKDNTYTEKHHYLSQSPKVAKLFSSAKSPEQDPFYKALSQALHAMVSLKENSLSIKPENSERKVETIFDFPVIICNSFEQIYAMDFCDSDKKNPEPITENFQLEVQYAYIDRRQTQRNDYFLLDVIEFDQIDNYMAVIKQDVESSAHIKSCYLKD
jgi:hypothetical protein